MIEPLLAPEQEVLTIEVVAVRPVPAVTVTLTVPEQLFASVKTTVCDPALTELKVPEV